MSQKDISNYLAHLNIQALNNMQQKTMDAFKENDSLILLSNTGSGKTLAFLLPMLQKLTHKIMHTQALIITPSRELALQIEDVFKQMKSGYKITCCYGGHKREIEENSLSQAPAVIVGTPGRLADHIRRGNIQVDNITMLFLDEFDKTLEFGFTEEVKFIVEALKNIKKTMLISATDIAELPGFIHLDNPVKLHFIEEEEDNKLLIQYLRSDESDKINTLFNLLCFVGNRLTIIFCNHRDAVERVNNLLKEKGISSVFYHGSMEQQERDTALAKFRNGSVNFLVTTDLASRGLDITNIRYIIHYHLPVSDDIFTHRNGRTARMDASGTAVVLLGPEEDFPAYIPENTEELKIPEHTKLPAKTDWTTVYLPLGKKDKISKADIVGFLIQQGELKKEDIGVIEVKDYHAFAAIRRNKASRTINKLKEARIKNKKAKMQMAR